MKATRWCVWLVAAWLMVLAGAALWTGRLAADAYGLNGGDDLHHMAVAYGLLMVVLARGLVRLRSWARPFGIFVLIHAAFMLAPVGLVFLAEMPFDGHYLTSGFALLSAAAVCLVAASRLHAPTARAVFGETCAPDLLQVGFGAV